MTNQRNTMAMRRHELLADVESRVLDAALELGVDRPQAQHLGAAVADMLTEQWAGQQITFPMNGYYGLSPRELEIVTRHSQGARVFELARQFCMSERGVRKLLKRAADGRSTASAQMSLFGPSSPQ